MTGGEQSRDALRLQVWLEEYKGLVTDIGARVELQQRNANVALVLLSAFTGYIVNVWNSHGTATLLTTPTALLIPVAPLLAQIFVWRHLDHDANIIDKAEYIEQAVRPSLVEVTGDHGILSFETWLNTARRRRSVSLTPLILLGNEHVAILAYGIAYLVAGWGIHVAVVGAAGDAGGYFSAILYAGTAATAISLVISVGSGLRFAKLASDPTHGAP